MMLTETSVRNEGRPPHSSISIRFLAGALFACLMLGGAARAAQAPAELPAGGPPGTDGPSVTLGAGGAMVPDYEGSEDYRFVPGLYLRAGRRGGRYVELQGLALRANLLTRGPWELGPVLRWRMGRDDVENDRVDRLEDVDASLEAGGFASVALGNWSLKAQAARDVIDGHGGWLAEAGAGYSRRLGPLFLSLSASAGWASGDYMAAYFGVDARNAARSGLKEFDADGGLKDVGVLLLARYSFDRTWGLMVLGKFSRLVGDAADSPLVEDEGSENQGMAAALLTYRF